MKITKVIGLDELRKVLKSSEYDHDKSELLVISDIIKSKQISNKDIFWTKNKLLIPSVNIINLYVISGKEAMEEAYKASLYLPESYFIINEIMYRVVKFDLDFFIMCSSDESEYDYIKYIGKFIQEVYGFKCLSLNKYLDGKKSKCSQDLQDLFEQINQTRNELVKKLKYANIDPISLLVDVNDKKKLKEMSKQMRLMVLNKLGDENNED